MFYATHNKHFHSESEERAGYWVRFGEHCGDAMSHILLDHDTQKIIYRSAVRPNKSSTPNHRLAPHGGEIDRISTKKEPCLAPTLMDEGQARNPNTTYNEYKMEFWKFALTWKLICPVQHKITQKEQKETIRKGEISLTIMGQRQSYIPIHNPQLSPNEMLGLNQDDHSYRMCNETGIP